jgi:O-antigen ligase
MIELGLLGFLLFVSLTLFLWKTVKFEWLDKVCTALVIALPFERIPSLEIGGANIRISQVVVIMGIWIWGVLFFKKDRRLSEIKLNTVNILLLLFIILSIPSAFMVIDSRRFIVTLAATYLCFGAVFLLSNFALNIGRKLKLLLYTFIIVSFFGLYQFLGDLAGLPIYLTGLREQYTKIVFGIPRVQGTALEPLYYANMMFLPIIYTVIAILARLNISLRKFTRSRYVKVFCLSLFMLVFVLTLSKAAYVVLASILFTIALYTRGKFQTNAIFIQAVKVLVYIAFVLSVVMLFFENVRSIVTNIIINFIDTATFQFASSIERLNFLQAALVLLPNNILIGLGSGQYGAWVNLWNLVNNNTPPGAELSYLIVNNVYLEVWLEFGILSFICFLAILLYPLVNNFKILRVSNNWKTPNNLARLTLVFTLIAAYLQWVTFSPIFIMPIFILIGLAANLAEDTSEDL